MPSTKPCVFLVAASRLMRETLPRLLHRQGDLNVCGVSACVPNISAEVAASGAKVVILDSTTALNSDVAVLPKIVAAVPNIKVVLITMEDDPTIFYKCIREGTLTYLPKDAGASDVSSAALAAAMGHTIYSKHLDGGFSRTEVRA